MEITTHPRTESEREVADGSSLSRTAATNGQHFNGYHTGQEKDAPAGAGTPAAASVVNGTLPAASGRPVLAVFCYEAPDSAVGQFLGQLAAALARRQRAVHIFARQPFPELGAGVTVQVVGESEGGLLDQVQEFTRRATNAFMTRFAADTARVALLGQEWSAIPALSLLRAARNLEYVLCLHSLERQRSDLGSDLSRQIEQVELSGLREARSILTRQQATAEVARHWMPASAARTAVVRQVFPAQNFERAIDPGKIKERYQIGPVDPTVLYIGDMTYRYGPDVLMKSVPAILKNHKQARFVFVGDGDMFWPLRVHARYLLLEHAVRLAGDVCGDQLHELIQAADVVVVPSRDATEWWQVQAAWAARRPVVVAQPVVAAMQLQHEQDCVAIYPHESSCVWGVERLLFDAQFCKALGTAGRNRLDERFGWNIVAEQVEELTAAATAR